VDDTAFDETGRNDREVGECVKQTIVIAAVLATALLADGSVKGEKLFKRWCWGCHHQTAEAFGPSFAAIAAKRDKETIMAMMSDPDGVSKTLGYRRNAMPAFNDLNASEKEALAEYILRFKDEK